MAMLHNSGTAGRVAKRLLDGFGGGIAVILCAPVLLIAAIGIKLSSPGPIFYRAQRTGKDGKPFSMFKLRTMHVNSDKHSAITAPGDGRIFGFGGLLRKFKLDELPQFWNVFIGDMSIVGPRPEDPKIVAREYNGWMMETLRIRPGLTSPGAVYGYCYGDTLLDPNDAERSYAKRLLPPKLALERGYLERATFTSDLGYCLLTGWAIVAQIRGKGVSIPSEDIDAARKWAPQGPYPSDRI